MPRKARPIPKQQFPTGLPYGRQQELQQQARALPMTPPPAPARQAAPPPPTAADPLSRITAEGWDLPDVTPLNAPTQRPGEPVTAGLPIGLGPGPEVLPRFTTPALAQTLQSLAEATGDPTFAYLAMLDEQARRS